MLDPATLTALAAALAGAGGGFLQQIIKSSTEKALGHQKATVDQLQLALKQIEDNSTQLALINVDYSRQRAELDAQAKTLLALMTDNLTLHDENKDLKIQAGIVLAKKNELEKKVIELSAKMEALVAERDTYKLKLSELENRMMLCAFTDTMPLSGRCERSQIY